MPSAASTWSCFVGDDDLPSSYLLYIASLTQFLTSRPTTKDSQEHVTCGVKKSPAIAVWLLLLQGVLLCRGLGQEGEEEECMSPEASRRITTAACSVAEQVERAVCAAVQAISPGKGAEGIWLGAKWQGRGGESIWPGERFGSSDKRKGGL